MARANWLLIAAAGFSAGATIADPRGSVFFTSLGLLSVFVALTDRFKFGLRLPVVGGLMVFLVGAVSNSQEMATFSLQPGSYQIWVFLSIGAAGTAFFSENSLTRKVSILLALGTLILGSAAILIPDWEPVVSSDVYRAHVAAGEALVSGQNPYSDAVVFESGDPNKPEGTLVVGYPYPPPALVSYGLISTVTDARVVSLVSWLFVAVALSVIALGKGIFSDAGLGALLLICTLPIWRMTLFMAWTEPMVVALIAGSLLAIGKNRKWGWVLLGVALASKQYLVVLAPVALMYRNEKGKRPGWVSLATAAAVTLFPAVFGVSTYFNAILGNTLGIGFRPDTQSINGVIAAFDGDFLIPFGLALLLVVGCAFWLWRRDIDQEMLLPGGTGLLAILFLTTSAFPNYWVLLAGLAGLSAIGVATANQDGRTHPSQSIAG